MIVSDGFTWPAIAARAKSCTRRNWKPETAAHFKAGAFFDSFDNATFAGGRKVARCRVVRDAYLERVGDAPLEDWHAEGFAYLNSHPQLIPSKALRQLWADDDCAERSFRRWTASAASLELWVVRYEIIHVEAAALARLDRLLEAA